MGWSGRPAAARLTSRHVSSKHEERSEHDDLKSDDSEVVRREDASGECRYRVARVPVEDPAKRRPGRKEMALGNGPEERNTIGCAGVLGNEIEREVREVQCRTQRPDSEW
jgi:hypothetical protein